MREASSGVAVRDKGKGLAKEKIRPKSSGSRRNKAAISFKLPPTPSSSFPAGKRTLLYPSSHRSRGLNVGLTRAAATSVKGRAAPQYKQLTRLGGLARRHASHLTISSI